MPALVSIQCNPIIQTFYHRLKENGKNGKVIVCAIMRKLVHLVFGILKRGSRLTRTMHLIVLDRENGIYKAGISTIS